ncbi:histone-lysine N-methyltransferase SMYD3 isoform X2 [Anopheles stephensi]|uniref:histone-lysine N-methyltransferase SMYD3 isoform X2 n=1 Tax=Anopheles stephensi TaxID=30069 RepID=UPI001658C3AE|nr:histone-lysine N-methyltransferase SMYD3 isoform X2 [Anopheles stephensi]
MKKSIYRRGDVILQEKPFACVLDPRYRDSRCDRCFKETKVMKCSNCLYVRYCGRSCQKEAWSDHKEECEKLKALPAGLVVPPAALMMARIVRRLLKGGDTYKGYYTSKRYRKFSDLMPHEENIQKDLKRMDHFASLFVVLQRLLDEVARPSKMELLRIYGKMCINTFNILDNEMNTIGTGMYIGASIIDHSCRPNVVVSFDGETLKMRLLEDYPEQELDFGKLFISYIDLIDTTDVRREQLSERYYFDCDCDRCRDEQEQRRMNAAACPNRNCQESVDMNDSELEHCPLCGTSITNSDRDTFTEISSFTRDHLAQMKNVAYLDVSRLCLKKQENILHRYNVHHIKTLDNAMESALNMEKWREAIGYGLRLLDGFRHYYSPYHPMLGLTYLKVGKLQLYECQFAEALIHLQQAAKIVRVTHGEQDDLYKRVLIPLLCDAAQGDLGHLAIKPTD